MRPLKAAPDRRTHCIGYRVTGEEAATIATLAARAQRTVSDLSRAATLGSRIIVTQTFLDPLMRHDLARIGNNLNQIARVMHATGELRRRDDLDELIGELRAFLARADTDELRQG